MVFEQNTQGRSVRSGMMIEQLRSGTGGVGRADPNVVRPIAANTNDPIPAPAETGMLGCTRIETTKGPVALNDLTPDHLVVTSTGATARLRYMLRTPQTRTALRLRAPYFGLTQDVILGAQTLFDVEDDLVEYMFNRPRVCIPAWAMRDNQRILHHEMGPRDTLVHVQLDTTDGFAMGRQFVTPLIAKETQSHYILNEAEARAYVTERKMGRYN